MPSLNKTLIIGNLGKDPELRFTANGSAVCTFSVACGHSFTDKSGEHQESTEWFSVVAWNKTAENCAQYLQKGRPVYVEGRMQTRSWDAPDGTKKYRTELVANQVLFLGARGDEPAAVGAKEDDEIDPEDLPFE